MKKLLIILTTLAVINESCDSYGRTPEKHKPQDVYYIIVEGSTADELQNAVAYQHANNSYQPQGGVFVGGGKYYQAMTK